MLVSACPIKFLTDTAATMISSNRIFPYFENAARSLIGRVREYGAISGLLVLLHFLRRFIPI